MTFTRWLYKNRFRTTPAWKGVAKLGRWIRNDADWPEEVPLEVYRAFLRHRKVDKFFDRSLITAHDTWKAIQEGVLSK